MRLNLFAAALVLPFFATMATAQVEAQVAGLTRNNSALRFQGVNCSPLNLGCSTNLPAASLAWAGGTAYDAGTGEFWVSEGNVLARVNPRGCGVSCGPYPAPTLGNAVVTGIEVLERTDELLVLDSAGTLNTLSLSGSCGNPQFISSCATGLHQVGQRVTSGLGADESRNLLFISYTNFATGDNSIAIVHLPTTCTPFAIRPLPTCGTPFGSVRGLTVDSCGHTLLVTDGVRLMSVHYFFDLTTMSMTFGTPECCPLLTTNLDPYVGLALRPSPGERVGQACSGGACHPCPMNHQLLTGSVIGNSNLLFHLDGAQGNSWTWLGLGYGHCSNSGPVIYPLCGPLLLGGGAVTPAPLVAGPYPIAGGPTPCGGSATVVVDFPYDLAFCGTDWSSQFISLCFGPIGTTQFGTAMSNCLSWTVIGP